MKKFIIFSFLFVVSQGLLAQNFYLDLGIGNGSAAIGEDRQGKLMLQVSVMKRVSDQLHLGLELSTGGNFIPADNTFTQGTTEILDPHRTQWSSALARAKYYPISTLSLYAGLGVGINSYWSNVNTLETDRISQINLALSPELGFDFSRNFNVGLRYLIGGSTSDFEGNRSPEYGGNLVRSFSQSVNLILITFNFRWGL